MEIVRIVVRGKFLRFWDEYIVVDYDNDNELRNASYQHNEELFLSLVSGDFSDRMVGLCERREDVADTISLPREHNS